MLNRDSIAHDFLLNSEKLLVKEAFDKADEFIAEAQKRKNVERPTVIGDDWILVKDRMPEENIRVLLFDADVGAISGHYLEKSWYLENFKDKGACVTHWQPLPNPPKGVSK